MGRPLVSSLLAGLPQYIGPVMAVPATAAHRTTTVTRRPRRLHGEGRQRAHGLLPATSTGSRSEEHTSELQSLMRISYAVFCLKKKKRSDTKSQENNTYK